MLDTPTTPNGKPRTDEDENQPDHNDVDEQFRKVKALMKALDIVAWETRNAADEDGENEGAMHELIDMVGKEFTGLERLYEAAHAAEWRARAKEAGNLDPEAKLSEPLEAVMLRDGIVSILERLARHWKRYHWEVVGRALVEADNRVRRDLSTPAEFEAYFGGDKAEPEPDGDEGGADARQGELAAPADDKADVPARIIELLDQMTAERFGRLSAEDRRRLGEVCLQWAERADAGLDPKDARIAREAKVLVGMRDLTLEDVQTMSPHELGVLSGYCRRIESLIVAAEQGGA